jgi:alpha-tubulin suppressor-like RCC1 family protein
MTQETSELIAFDYFGLTLWYDLELYDGTIWSCGAQTANDDGKLDLWDHFTTAFQDKLYKVIKAHAEATFWELRGGRSYE